MGSTISFPTISYDMGLTIPARDATLQGGAAVCASLPQAPTQVRDNMLISQLLLGNIPDNSKPSIEINISDDKGNTLKYFVAPDYLAVGSNEDNVRIPMGAPAYRKLADIFGCALPTYLISNQIHQRADLKLIPQTMTPDASMILTKTFVEHNKKVNQNIKNPFQLLDGAKKDIIFNSQLLALPQNLGLYGWHYPNGKVIQPIQCQAHISSYQDYSQGVRLIARKMLLNKVAIDYYALLNYPDYHHLISGELLPYNAHPIYI